GQIVVCACFDAANDALGVATGRENQHRGFGGRVSLADHLTQLDPVHTGHHHIEDDQIGVVFLKHRQRRIGIACLEDIETTTFEHDADEGERPYFIIYDQDVTFHTSVPTR